MGVYLYAILPAGHAPPSNVKGLDGVAVRAIAQRQLMLWVSDAERPVEPTVERIRAHNSVVETAATSEITPVPVRFGQWWSSEVEAVKGVSEKHDDYVAALDRVAGAVEFGVLVVDPRQAVPRDEPEQQGQATSGRAYMERLARASRSSLSESADAVARSLESALGALARDTRTAPLTSPHGVLSVAHLVGRHDIPTYRAALDSFRDRFGELRFLVSGPWPPYSFVG